jgi:3-phenylpropionate/trans-cinnamate dioxygenase ferredoxin subunit
MADFVPALKVSDLPKGTKKAVFISGKRIMVVNAGGQYFAMDDTCTHAGCGLTGEGFIDGETITCGCHGSQFDLATGKVLSPPATVPMHIYHAKVEGDSIMVAV